MACQKELQDLTTAELPMPLILALIATSTAADAPEQ
jgi:hypothetical protein